MLTYIAAGIGATLLISIAGFVIGALLAVPLTILRTARFAPARWLAGGYVGIIRAVPTLVWLFLIFFGLTQIDIKLSPVMAAVVTFGLIATAYLTEIYRSGAAAIDSGQREASDAVGLGRIDTLRFILVPQIFRVVGPTMATYWIGLLKDSALASTIGVLELTFRANSDAQQTGSGLTAFGIAGVIYLILSLPVAVLSRRVDALLRAKYSVV